MVECEDCKQKFEITSGEAAHSITYKKEFNVNGQSIFLTYYDCPSCGRRHYVQIDNRTSLNKHKEVSRQFVKLAVAKKRGKEIPQKQLAKFKKTRQNLSDYRMNLMKQYTGKLIHDNETDSDFVLRFSV
jgi:DNA-directed RNA polymerase subunit RPC12/RpoP